MWKDFFSFTKQERQGILILLALIAGIFAGKFFFSTKEPVSVENHIVREQLPRHQQEEKYAQEREPVNYPSTNETVIVLKPFDPNSASHSTFISLGLKPYVAQNIIKYRNKGGKFKKPDDLAKIYGLSNEDFVKIRPYIRIKSEENKSPVIHPVAKDTARKTIYHKQDHKQENAGRIQKQEKIALGTVIDINLADTAGLKKIPHIGSAFARRIVKYRQLLGGFYSIEQLKEVYGLDNELFLKISPYVTISENPGLQTIAVNQSSLDKLKSHPYINFYQAKIIIELRKKKNKIRNISELVLLEEFSETDLERLGRYLSFE